MDKKRWCCLLPSTSKKVHRSNGKYGKGGSGNPKDLFFITVKVKVSMKTKFNTLMFSRFHLSEMDSLPSKTYKAVISALLHYFYDDEEPDFSKLRKPEVAMKYFKRIASYIETGLNKTA